MCNLRGGGQLGKGGLVLPECFRAWRAPSQGKLANSLNSSHRVVYSRAVGPASLHRTKIKAEMTARVQSSLGTLLTHSLALRQEWRWPDHLQHDALVSVATVTDCHKRSGLKQHEFIILYFRRSEVQNHFHWATVKMSDLCPFRRHKGRIYFVPFPASRNHLSFFWLIALSFIFRASNVAYSLLSDLCFCPYVFSLSLIL